MGQIILSQCWREFEPRKRDSHGYTKRSENFSDEVTGGRRYHKRNKNFDTENRNLKLVFKKLKKLKRSNKKIKTLFRNTQNYFKTKWTNLE